MDSYITSLMTNLGYFGMFLGMVLEAVIIIIPSELILATAGILAGRGFFSFYMARYAQTLVDFDYSYYRAYLYSTFFISRISFYETL